MTTKNKIETLVKKLLAELEKQGYDIYTENGGHVDIWHHNSINDRVYMENCLNNWRIDCGTYENKLTERQVD